MSKHGEQTHADIRERFASMDPLAILSKEEFAGLLATTPGALGQMQYLDELPETAFPQKRRACWFVRDVRAWLEGQALRRESQTLKNPMSLSNGVSLGRPRSEHEEAKK